MPEIKRIQELYELYGSYKRVARELHISKNTVKKYLHRIDDVRDGTVEEILPKHRTISRTRTVLTDALVAKIHQYLDSSSTYHEKQQITAKRIWELLIKENETVSYTSVKKVVSKYRAAHTIRTVSILQDPQQGIRAEFDWGMVILRIKGIEHRYSLAVIVSLHSLYRFARLYHRETRYEVIDAHLAFFNEIGAVPKTLFYDRMSTAYDSKKHQFHESFLEFALYFGFEPCACNVASPQEKGTDEESVGYVRRHAFGERSEFDSFEEAEEWLSMSLAEINSHPVYRRNEAPSLSLLSEVHEMLPLPTLAYSNFELRRGTINRYSLVSYETNLYSVPETYCSRHIHYTVTVRTIEFLDGDTIIATHRRLFGKGGYSMDILHYIKTFQMKPRALKYSKVMAGVDPRIQDLFNTQYSGNPQPFLDILDLAKETSVTQICEALDHLKRWNIQPEYSAIRFAINGRMQQPHIETLEIPMGFPVLEPDLKEYDRMMDVTR